MRHKLLVDYLTIVERAIEQCELAYVEQYIEEFAIPEESTYVFVFASQKVIYSL